MLRIRRVDRRNWSAWAPIVLQVMHKVFPRKLWWTAKDYEEHFEIEAYIARLATIDNEFVGFACGFQAEPQEGLGEVQPGCKVMHLFYLFITPAFQGRGYGFAMLEDFASQSQKRGYSKLTGLLKSGPSLTNMRKLGTKELGIEQNYYGTGQTYIFCATDLRSAERHRQQ